MVEGVLEVVPGGGEGGAAGQGQVVAGLQVERSLEGPLRLGVAGGVALGAGLFHVAEAEGGPAGEVLRLGAQVGLEGGDAGVEVGGREEAGGHGGGGRGDTPAVVVACRADRHGAGGEGDGEEGGASREVESAAAPAGRGRTAYGGDPAGLLAPDDTGRRRECGSVLPLAVGRPRVILLLPRRPDAPHRGGALVGALAGPRQRGAPWRGRQVGDIPDVVVPLGLVVVRARGHALSSITLLWTGLVAWGGAARAVGASPAGRAGRGAG